MKGRWILAAALLGGLGAVPASAAALSREQVNKAEWKRTLRAATARDAVVLKAQVLLDRASLSPGAIDGMYGSNLRKALTVFQSLRKLPAKGALDRKTWQALTKGAKDPVLTTYTLTAQDVKGPFAKSIPAAMRKKAALKRLAYTSPRELLAEKFHTDEGLLKALNPGASFTKAGAKIVVPNVLGVKPEGTVKSVVVDKKAGAVKAYDGSGGLIAYYPATVGSSDFPSPSGKLKVKSVAENPTFTYSSNLKYAKLKKGEKLTIPGGPNNPVGNIWIDLSKQGYGIHGTPEPVRVSKSESHGCVRLMNWDAQELARLVTAGTPVLFSD